MLNDFIIKSNIIHNNKYTYSEVIYINQKTKVNIICPIHNLFSQTPKLHLKTSGCLKCFILKKSKSQEKYILKCKQVHGDTYDYSKTQYINKRSYIVITCLTHGDFKQIAGNHINGSGCRDCSIAKQKLSLQQFISRCNLIHKSKYNYSKSIYINITNKIIIICPRHKEFEQIANDHINGQGCRKCSNTVSHKENHWLDHLNVKSCYRQQAVVINNLKFKVDALDYKQNII